MDINKAWGGLGVGGRGNSTLPTFDATNFIFRLNSQKTNNVNGIHTIKENITKRNILLRHVLGGTHPTQNRAR